MVKSPSEAWMDKYIFAQLQFWHKNSSEYLNEVTELKANEWLLKEFKHFSSDDLTGFLSFLNNHHTSPF